MDNIEDLYQLSPIQAGILFHGLYSPGSGLYFNQLICTLHGNLNVAVFQQAWQQVVNNHAVLRTSFFWEELEKPIQVVQRRVEIIIEQQDWSSLSTGEQQERLGAFLDRDRARGVELSTPPLMRFTLIRLTQDAYQFIWSYHHLLMDGWSKSAIIKEVVTSYEAMCRREEVVLEPRRSFVDYIRWLEQQDASKAEAFWRIALKEFTAPTDLRFDSVAPPTPGLYESHGKQQAMLPEKETAALQSLGRQHQLTLNTIVQGAWALMLSHRSGKDDVMFGAVVSGRPFTLSGVESMIGLFINTLPVRVRLPEDTPLLDSLKRLQQQQVEMRQYEYSPLVQVHGWSELPRGLPLFDSILTFENYPVETASKELGLSIEIRDVRHISRNNYSLTTLVEPGARLSMQILYDLNHFNAATIARILEQMQRLLADITMRPDATPRHLKEALAEIERTKQIMEERKQIEKSANKFKSIKPRAVSLAQVELMRTRYLTPEASLPLVFEPNVDNVDLIDWAKNNRESIENELLKHGALLFRGFNMKSSSDFEQLAQAACPQLFGEYGDLPREGLGGKVYGSTPYPSDQTILFHNESSHMHRWPLKIFFFCVKAAQQGGETPIVDCRKVYQLLSPELREAFTQKKLMYVRNYIEGIDVSWSEFFHTSDRAAVEEYCQQASIGFEWKENNSLRTRKTCQAVARHPRTGEMVFFNQIQLHHVSCLDPFVAESMQSMFKPEDLPRYVCYGDGSLIEDSVMKQIGEIYWKSAVSFPWQEGDILMLDNMLTAHARLPYVGPRKIVVAMGEMIQKSKDV